MNVNMDEHPQQASDKPHNKNILRHDLFNEFSIWGGTIFQKQLKIKNAKRKDTLCVTYSTRVRSTITRIVKVTAGQVGSPEQQQK